MHAQPYPTIWNNQKNIFGIPSDAVSPCEDCVEPTYPSTEITSQCTDQCVVIACNDPDHNEVNQCHGTGDLRCDLVCDGATNCDGFDEFLQCCTNYHSYFSEPRNTDQLSNTSFSWDSSYEEFLCSCNGSPLASTQPATNSLSPVGPVSSIDIPADEISPALPLPSPHPTQYAVPSIISANGSELLTCMWGNCQASFTSLPELVGHVNLEHLRLPSSPRQTNYVAPTRPGVSPLSCQWRDCSIYPLSESIPNSSSGDHVDDVLKILASHLLHDHLGMNGNSRPPTPADMTKDKVDNSLQSLQPLAHPAVRSVSPSPSASTHKCQWQSCGHSFNTYEDLTSHITVVHVGGGKAQYECLWEGCNRNGTNGFSSKQKICRHLQSHTGHRPYQCTICQQYFSEAATLQQHMRRHTQEKPYVCDYPGCGKTFAITGALTIHKRIHNGHKPFKCKFCDKAFAESSNLSKHLRTHTGARPYCCPEPGCNKSFARPDQLTRHLGVHRKKSPDQRER